MALNNNIVALTGVEVCDLTFHQLAKATGESVSEMDFSLPPCRHRRQQGAGDREGTNKALLHVSSKAPLVVLHSISIGGSAVLRLANCRNDNVRKI